MDYEPGGRDIGHTYNKLSQMLQCTSDSPRSQVQNLAQPIIIHTEKQPTMLNQTKEPECLRLQFLGKTSSFTFLNPYVN